MLTALYIITNPIINQQIGNAEGNPPADMVQLLFRNIITATMGLAGAYFFINLLLGGYLYISAGGEKEAIQKATGKIKNAIIGLAIVLSVYAITWTVGTIFGITLTEFNLPSLREDGAGPPMDTP